MRDTPLRTPTHTKYVMDASRCLFCSSKWVKEAGTLRGVSIIVFVFPQRKRRLLGLKVYIRHESLVSVIPLFGPALGHKVQRIFARSSARWVLPCSTPAPGTNVGKRRSKFSSSRRRILNHTKECGAFVSHSPAFGRPPGRLDHLAQADTTAGAALLTHVVALAHQ